MTRLVRHFVRSVALVATVLCAAAGAASSQESAAPPAPALLLELNGAQSSDKGCRLTFVVTNNLGAALSRAAFEIALFNADGVVDRLTILDFNTLPAGKTKVVRFDLPGTDCGQVSRVLVNDATECVGDGVEPNSCMAQLNPTSRSGISFGL